MPNYTNNEVNQLWFYTLEALTDPIVLVSCVHIRTGLSHEYGQMVEGTMGLRFDCYNNTAACRGEIRWDESIMLLQKKLTNVVRAELYQWQKLRNSWQAKAELRSHLTLY